MYMYTYIYIYIYMYVYICIYTYIIRPFTHPPIYIIISLLSCMLIHDVLISLTATYLLGCQEVNEQMRADIWDLCWIDQDTLIAADWGGRQLVKYTINSVTRTCTGQVLDSGYAVHSVGCSVGGLVFVTEYTTGVVMVRVINVNTGQREEVWNTNINSQSEIVRVSLSAGYIVLSAGNKSYIYNKDRTLLYSVTHDQVSLCSFRPMSLRQGSSGVLLRRDSNCSSWT